MSFRYLRESLRRISKIIGWGNDLVTRGCHAAKIHCGRSVGMEAMPDINTVKGLLESWMGGWTSLGVASLRPLGIMVVVFIASQPMAWGATYYLRADGTAADKSSATSCSSPDTAMSLQMPRYIWESFAPGDRIVLCNEGGIFRGELQIFSNGTAASPITYDGRGSAVISASDLVHGWAPVGGSLYVASLSIQPQQVFVNGNFGDRKPSLGEVTSNLDWYWEANQLYLYSSTGNPDVAFDNPGVEAGSRSLCAILKGDHVVITGITARHSNRNGFSGWNPGSNVTIRNCLAEWNWYKGIAMEGDDSLYENTVIEDNVTRFNGIGGIGLSGPGKNSIIRRNRCLSNGKYQSAEYVYDGMQQWTFGIKLFENETNFQEGNEIYENLVYDNGRGHPEDKQGRGTGIWIDTVPGKPANPMIIRHNLVYSNKGNGIFIEISSNTVVFGNLLHNNASNERGTGGATPANIVIDSRLDYQSDNNLVYSNTLYGGRAGIKLNTYGQSSGCSINNNQVKNNIVIGASEHRLLCDSGGDNDGVWGVGNVYEHNSFGEESDDFISWNATRYNTYADWESAYGGPSHSIEGDPQLAGSSRNDLYLTASSPCRDAGADLGPVYDDALLELSGWVDSVETSDQDWYGGGWEAGAYVYSGFNPILFTDGFESGDTMEWTVAIF